MQSRIGKRMTLQERRTASAGVWHGLVRGDEPGEHALLALEEPVGGVVAADAGCDVGAALEHLLGTATVLLALRGKREFNGLLLVGANHHSHQRWAQRE